MKAEKTKKYLAIDSHAHIQVSHGSEQNWEFPSIEAHRAYCQRSVYARRKRVYRFDEDNIRIPDIVTEVVGHPNVYLELLPLATNEYFHPRIDDVIRAEYDAFGPRKFVWGSEFIKHLPGGAPAEPFTAAHYAELYHYLEEKHPYLSEDDLGLIRGGNLQRIFRISKTLY